MARRSWRGLLLDLGHRAEGGWDAWRRRAKARLGWTRPATIQPFYGYGDARRVRLNARVLERGGRGRPRLGISVADNLVHMFHRFESDEVPGARVRAAAGGRVVEVVADDEGYVEIALDGIEPGPADGGGGGWREVTLELLSPLAPGQAPVRVAARVLAPPASARLAVVSDVDDTIVRTGAANLLRNIRTTLLNSAKSRTPFPGVAAFYRALERGGGGASAGNPVFYVSSSPWNLFDLLDEFMALHGIPPGPLFLRDLGLDRAKLIQSSHAEHKLAAIERLIAFYPDLRFILIGDSGQHDAAIYREAVDRHPARVAAVYIRDLSPDAREPETHALLDEVRRAGTSAVLSPDLVAAAEDAAAQGWIAASAVAEVRAEVEAGRRRRRPPAAAVTESTPS